ncbi:c6 zinc finger domain protein [Rutstroemia sp. NJR-2017a BBW]|nr:c6 zinc finger domain protein [Rutstroemia sp. NJR-2017a BBW]
MADAEPVKAVRQRRASRPKVKTGCNNCKTRRVKCDETRPQCTKCVRSGRTCDGYPAYNPRNRNLDTIVPIAPRPPIGPRSAITSSSQTFSTTPATSTSSVIVPARRPVRNGSALRASLATTPITSFSVDPSFIARSPAFGLPFNTTEAQYFQVFRTHTASELSGFFDSEFWTRSVLQESHSEASIRHAVVALGALYKTLEKVTESPPSSPQNSEQSSVDSAAKHWEFAWENYGKAITRMRQSMENGEVRSQRTILISSVLFTCFQSFVGDHKNAIRQVQVGLGVMEKQRRERRRSFIQREDDIVEEELGQMFTRLAVQAKSYDMAFHFPDPYVIRLSTNSSIANPQSPSSASSPSDTSTTASFDSPVSESFSNVHEARLVLDAICERTLRYNEELAGFYAVSNKILPAHIISNGYGFGKSLEQWQINFEPLLKGRRDRGKTNTERAGIIVLQMTCTMTRILVHTAFCPNEMGFDQFHDMFEEINELAKELIVDEELAIAQARCGEACHVNYASPSPSIHHDDDTYSHIKPSFALDSGIVPPLFVVATKCRDRKLRREAISLLTSSHRREGMWDSKLCAGVGKWVMEMEEEGLNPYDLRTRGQVVPEGKRVMVTEITFNLEKRWATLRCGTRGLRKGEWDERARETPVHW